MAYLTVRIKGVEGYSKSQLDKDRLVVGRAATCDVVIKHSSISREHCALVRQGEAWQVEDMGSANGTQINKVKIDKTAPVKEKDIIACGQARMTFHAGSQKDVEAAVDLNLEEGSDGPVRRRGAEDPPEAVPCGGCGAWLSIAHRIAGDTQVCPRCSHKNVVPNLVS